MKYFIIIATILCLGSIASGLILDVNYSQKLIGFGVVGLFIVVFPVFSYYRWKDKDIKDYMITQENLDKMKNHEKDA
ncbi:hypothetical protein [Lacinutrix undariae]